MKKSGRGSDLICGVNWLGDSIMSMPALQLHRAAHPDRHIAILVKPPLMSLWQLHPAIDEVIALPRGARSTVGLARFLRSRHFTRALVFPNSFRSALIPFLARIPERVGTPGHQRAWMLSRVVNPPGEAAHVHQAWEYFRILGLPDLDEVPAPDCPPPVPLTTRIRSRLQLASTDHFLAVFPGAARGPSKQWPASRFADAVRSFLDNHPDAGCLVFGTPAEEMLCRQLAGDIGARTRSVAGMFDIPETLAALRFCPVALTNDSGGMHLASAAGCRVVAVFGLTDPDKTGPLGPGHRVIQPDGVTVSRDIPRRSRKAAEALAAIGPNRVATALDDAWKEGRA